MAEEERTEHVHRIQTHLVFINVIVLLVVVVGFLPPAEKSNRRQRPEGERARDPAPATMSQSRRVRFTTLADDAPYPMDGDKHTDQRSDAVGKTLESHPDRAAQTVRLALTLFDSDERSCPEFSYSQRVQQVARAAPPRPLYSGLELHF